MHRKSQNAYPGRNVSLCDGCYLADMRERERTENKHQVPYTDKERCAYVFSRMPRMSSCMHMQSGARIHICMCALACTNLRKSACISLCMCMHTPWAWRIAIHKAVQLAYFLSIVTEMARTCTKADRCMISGDKHEDVIHNYILFSKGAAPPWRDCFCISFLPW